MFEFSRPGAAGWGRMTRCNPNSWMESQRDSSPHLTGEDQCEDCRLSENYLALFVYQLIEAVWHGRGSIGVGLLLCTSVWQGSHLDPQSMTTIQLRVYVFRPIFKMGNTK
jgi:hypothetical protein